MLTESHLVCWWRLSILNFQIPALLTADELRRSHSQMHHIAKFHRNQSSGCEDTAIYPVFQDGGRPPSWILYSTLLDHPRRVFGGLYCYAKFGWNPCSCFHDTNVCISCAFDLKMPIHVPKQNRPFPFVHVYPRIIHPFLDRPHSPSQTASRSTQPFCHNTLSGHTHTQTNRWDRRRVSKKSAYARYSDRERRTKHAITIPQTLKETRNMCSRIDVQQQQHTSRITMRP